MGKFAQVNNITGEVEVIYTTTKGQPEPKVGNNGITTILDISEMDISTNFFTDKYFNTETMTWFDKPAKPSDYHEFCMGEWTLNQPSLAIEIRRQRNIRLMNSDWTQLPDVALSEEEKTAWKNYRQLLRDITSNLTATTMEEIVWPIPPN